MSIILNGTTLDGNANIVYNDTSLNKIIYNGVTVWTKLKMPSKGDRISMYLRSKYSPDLYRVLNVNGSIAEVVALYDYGDSIRFNENATYTSFGESTNLGQKYEDSTVDTYLNTTFYNDLLDTAKSAIVAKNITQSMWTYLGSNPSNTDNCYKIKHENGFIFYYRNDNYESALTSNRNIYALSVEDIFNFLSATTSNTIPYSDITSYFSPSNATESWLRTARYNVKNQVLCFASNGWITVNSYNSFCSVRPAFQIDLSKIDYTKT